MSFSAIADAANATGRLYGVFEAELLTETHIQDDDLDVALEVKGGSFTWDSPPPEATEAKKRGGKGPKGTAAEKALAKRKAADDAREAAAAKTKREEAEEERVFRVQDVDMRVGRGQLVAIVGAVGSGKTSLLQGVIGEMRKTGGEIRFGGSVGYCPQSAWIQVGGLWPFTSHG